MNVLVWICTYVWDYANFTINTKLAKARENKIFLCLKHLHIKLLKQDKYQQINIDSKKPQLKNKYLQ